MKATDLLTVSSLFGSPEHTLAAPYLASVTYPWEILSRIPGMIQEIGATLSAEEYRRVGEDVWIAKDAVVAPTASISGPCIIGHGTEVRHCAFIRGAALVGDGAVVGNSTELKNCILFDGVQVPHYNYVGDSILGYKSHLGAGAITSNVKSDKTNVAIRVGEEKIATGCRKLGAILGDFVEVGCGSVLNPGTVIGSHSNVYPLSAVRGYIPENSIYKASGCIVTKHD
ncbi:MAG: UDP-N-acetylglucosamine pyrophosphorylase [Clostridia bacterium]|nr:UDP-N-acetylglucosamine pyrophosphorylase [Clostridia bacterium]